MKLLRSIVAVFVIVGMGACGGGGSPTAPTAPPTTPPVPPPSAQLRLVVQDLLIPDWPCPTGACRYAFDVQNLGPDCATAISGTFRLFNADGTTLLASDTWTLDPALVVRPQDILRVEDAPIAREAIEMLGDAGGTYSVTFAFTAARCS